MSGVKPRVAITPATKVAELLDSWPELEEMLIEHAPAFRRLRNPVLRRTVARVATLEQAAGVGGVPVQGLVAALRRAAGLAVGSEPLTAGIGADSAEEFPAWAAEGRVVEAIDAEALLDAGQVPLRLVGVRARSLASGEVLRVMSRFRPVPLVEALAKLGCSSVTREVEPGRYETLVAAPRAEC